METERKPPYVIAVCGASCSGKTTVASSLAEKLNQTTQTSEGATTANARVLVFEHSVANSPDSRVARSLSRSLSSVGGSPCTRDRAISDVTSAQMSPPDIPLAMTRSKSGPALVASSPLQRAKSAVEKDAAEGSHAISGDDFFIFDEYITDSCPSKEVNGRIWKDWESIDSIDWKAYIEAVKKAKEDPDCPKYIVIEGFLLMATPESRQLFDAVIDVKLTKEECWSRRKSRAEKMQHLPPGFSEGDEEKNYEVLATYIKSTADPTEFLAAAATQFPDEGDLAWLRLYFEEVMWPAAHAQQIAIESCGLPKLELDACVPLGKEEWKEANVPKALEFISALLSAKS